MSEAFRQQWLRLGAAHRLNIIVAYLTRKGDIHIPLDELETVVEGEGASQSFVDNELVLHHAPRGTQLFMVGRAQAEERRPINETPLWQTQDASDLPARLLEKLGEQPSQRRPLTTTDDQEMAAREARSYQTSTQQRARAIREQPLPVTQPSQPPDQ